jgi:hypothetical protein
VNDNTGVLPWWGERWHKAAFVFFLVCCGWCVVVDLRSAFAPDWMVNLVLMSGLLTSFVTLGRQLPVQNVVIAAIMFSFAGALWACFAAMSLDGKGELNWRMTMLWTIILLNARAIGQFVLRSRRQARFYGWELMGVSAGVFTLAVAALYKQALLIVVAPVAVAGLLFFTLPFMLSKRSAEPPVNSQPIVVLLLLLVWASLPRI